MLNAFLQTVGVGFIVGVCLFIRDIVEDWAEYANQ